MEKMTFWGDRRPDGRVGIRNKILILPASVSALPELLTWYTPQEKLF